LFLYASKKALAEAIVAAFQKDFQPYVDGIENTLELLAIFSDVTRMITNARFEAYKYPSGHDPNHNQHLWPPLEFIISDDSRGDVHIYEWTRSSRGGHAFAFASIYENGT
jgi:hypothetical protein